MLALELLLGVSAVGGGIAVAGSPSGDLLGFELEHLDGSPFVNYLFPGLWLLVFAGLGSLGAFWLTLRRSPVAAYAAAFAGFSIAVFEAVEVTVVPFHFLMALFFMVGVAMVALSLRMERDASTARSVAKRAVSLLNWRFAAATFAVLIATYVFVLQPWLTNVGSTSAERAAAYPGDELKADPIWQTTRSITINAPADVVWSWLIQHGQDRAGFYSYDWLENLLGSDIHNGNELRADWQRREPGDRIPMYRKVGDDYLDLSILRVDQARADQLLLTTSEAGDTESRVLIPVDANTTRLIFRDREGTGADKNLIGSAFHYAVYEPMHFVMQRRMMVGIKLRAEGIAGEPQVLHRAAALGWALAGVALAYGFYRNRRARPWAVIPLLAAAPALLLATDPSSALAAALAFGSATLGTVTWGWRWWPRFSVIGAMVLLALVLAADAYLVFGLGFIVIAAGALLARVLLDDQREVAALKAG